MEWIKKGFHKIYNKHIIKLLPINNYLNYRGMIRFLHDKKEKNLVGVEIGVLNGFNALYMLDVLHIKMLYLVDIIIKPSTRKRLSKYKNVTFIQSKSCNALKHIPDNVDFVYIDGDHTYSGVKKDMQLYYKKVRKGGILGGHDFCANHIELCIAVVEFTKNHILHGHFKDWWIKK